MWVHQPGQVLRGAAGDGLGAAEFEKRARAALGAKLGWRCPAARDEGMSGGGSPVGRRTESGIEGNVVAALDGAVEDRASGNRLAEHFLQAERLGAELNGVGGLVFGAATFVLDGEGLPRAVGLAVKLDDVGHAVEVECGGLQRQGAHDAQVAAALAAGFVGLVVEHAALGGEAVLGPLALDVNERALARAEREVLQGGERKRGVVGGRQRWGRGGLLAAVQRVWRMRHAPARRPTLVRDRALAQIHSSMVTPVGSAAVSRVTV